MMIRPDLFDKGTQFEDYCDQFEDRKYTIKSVRENFNERRLNHAEGYKIQIGRFLDPDDYIETNVLIQEHTNPMHEEKDVRIAHIPIDVDFKRGYYLKWFLEIERENKINHEEQVWLIFSEKRYIDGAFWSVQIRQCNYLMKWIDKSSRRLCEHWVVTMSKNSYSSGVWSNTFSQFVDGETACIVPFYSDEIKRITRDDRRLMTHNSLNPTSYYISNIKEVIMEGCVVLNLTEDEPSPVYDDYENLIADRWKLENVFKLIIINGKSFKIGLNQNAQIQVKVESLNTLNDTKSFVQNPQIEFHSINEEMLKVYNDGTIQPFRTGATYVDVKFIANKEVVDTQRVEIIIEKIDIDEYKLDILGNNTIFFDMSSLFVPRLFKNGLEIEDVFEFELIDDEGLPVDKTIAIFSNKSDINCRIKAFETDSVILLIVKSTNYIAEATKIITIKDIL